MKMGKELELLKLVETIRQHIGEAGRNLSYAGCIWSEIGNKSMAGRMRELESLLGYVVNTALEWHKTILEIKRKEEIGPTVFDMKTLGEDLGDDENE